MAFRVLFYGAYMTQNVLPPAGEKQIPCSPGVRSFHKSPRAWMYFSTRVRPAGRTRGKSGIDLHIPLWTILAMHPIHGPATSFVRGPHRPPQEWKVEAHFP